MEYLILASVLVSFFLAMLILPKWIKKCQIAGMLWEDMNKQDKPKNVAASGGVPVIMAFTFGVLLYIAIRTFILMDGEISLQIFSLLTVILIAAIIGLTDDLLGWKNEGMSARFRVLLALFASIPLIVINAGTHTMNFPFLGTVNFGILYPLFLIPLGVAGATTTYNFLAGFAGLEAGQGVLILSFFSFVAYTTGSPWLALVGLCMVASLIAFLFFNFSPAKVFPGDVMTYSIGALIAGMAILGNFEKIAIIVFIPYIAETILKSRGGLKKSSFGRPCRDGSLEMPFKKIYGLTHLSLFILKRLKKKVYERDVVYLIFVIQIIFILLGFLAL